MPSYIGQWIGENLLFSSFLEADDRMPCVTFTVWPPKSIVAIVLHHLLHEEEKQIVGMKFGLLLPRAEFWIALVSVRVSASFLFDRGYIII